MSDAVLLYSCCFFLKMHFLSWNLWALKYGSVFVTFFIILAALCEINFLLKL